MPFKINHIHIKSADPRRTAEWYEKAFAFKIVSDETRVFGDRFIRCNSGDAGLIVSISNARTNEKLGPADATAHYGLEHFAIESMTSKPTSHACKSSAPSCKRGRSRRPMACASPFWARPTTCASSSSNCPRNPRREDQTYFAIVGPVSLGPVPEGLSPAADVQLAKVP